MAKTLILTDKQLNEIIDGSPYLDDVQDSMPENGYLNQQTISGGVDTEDPKFKPTSDSIGKMMGPPTNHWPGAKCTSSGRITGIPIAAGLGESYTKKDFEKKMLQELNRDLANITMTATIPNPDDPYNPKTITGDENMLSTRKSRAEKAGDEDTAKAIDVTLNVQRQRIKSGKKIRQQMGMPNQFQKPGGTKNNGGTAHTKKDSTISVLDSTDNNN